MIENIIFAFKHLCTWWIDDQWSFFVIYDRYSITKIFLDALYTKKPNIQYQQNNVYNNSAYNFENNFFSHYCLHNLFFIYFTLQDQ